MAQVGRDLPLLCRLPPPPSLDRLNSGLREKPVARANRPLRLTAFPDRKAGFPSTLCILSMGTFNMEMIASILAAEHFRDDNQRSPSLPTLQAVQADVLGMAEYQPEVRLPYRESWIGWVVPSYARASSARNLYPVAARYHGRRYTRACRGEAKQTQRRHGRQNCRHGARRSNAICSVAQKAIRTSQLRTRLTAAFRKTVTTNPAL